jgi:hypothetical protein
MQQENLTEMLRLSQAATAAAQVVNVELQEELATSRSENAALEEQLSDCIVAKTETEAHNAALQQQLADCTASKAAADLYNAALQQQLADCTASKAAAEAENARLRLQVIEVTATAAAGVRAQEALAVVVQYGIDSYQEVVDYWRAKFEAAKISAADATAAGAVVQEALTAAQQQLQQAEAAAATANRQKEGLEGEVEGLRVLLAAREKEVEELKAKVSTSDGAEADPAEEAAEARTASTAALEKLPVPKGLQDNAAQPRRVFQEPQQQFHRQNFSGSSSGSKGFVPASSWGGRQNGSIPTPTAGSVAVHPFIASAFKGLKVGHTPEGSQMGGQQQGQAGRIDIQKAVYIPVLNNKTPARGGPRQGRFSDDTAGRDRRLG